MINKDRLHNRSMRKKKSSGLISGKQHQMNAHGWLSFALKTWLLYQFNVYQENLFVRVKLKEIYIYMRKSAIMSLFCKSDELNSYSYMGKHNLYLYSKFCCSGINTMLTVVAMATVHHDYRPTFVRFYKKSDVAFDSLSCYFCQTL